MPVSLDTLKNHLAYTAWASQRLVNAAAQISESELTRDFQTADHSVLGTLVHIYAADRLWLSRLANTPHPGFTTEADFHLSVLQNDWPALHGRWMQWAEGLTDESVRAMVSYTDMKGMPWTQPLWQCVLHVVNHATHHRGQAAGFLRTLGYLPPPLDLIYFYREPKP